MYEAVAAVLRGRKCKIISSLQQKHPRRVIVHGMNGRHNFGCTTSCQSSILPPAGKCATRSHQHQMPPTSVRQNNIAIRQPAAPKSSRTTGQAAQLFHTAGALRHHKTKPCAAVQMAALLKHDPLPSQHTPHPPLCVQQQADEATHAAAHAQKGAALYSPASC